MIRPGRYAVLDIGTNSIPYLIGEIGPLGGLYVFEEGAPVTRLGKGLYREGIITDEELKQTADTINSIAANAVKYNVSDIFICGTQVFRSAKNGEAAAEEIKSRCGLEIEILSGEVEAGFAYLAQRPLRQKGTGRYTVIDVGGGSSEIISGTGTTPDFTVSAHIGAVGITQICLPNDPAKQEDIAVAQDKINQALSPITVPADTGQLIAIAGTATTLAAMLMELTLYDTKKVTGKIIPAEELAMLIEKLSSLSVSQRKGLTGLQPARADIILGGALILQAILNLTKASELTVSGYGVRHGLLYSKCGVPEYV